MAETIEENAELLVDRIVKALTHSRRDIAVRLALDALAGHEAVSVEQLEDLFDTNKRIWEMAGLLFHGEPARWRNLVGQLIKVCKVDAAYEVMLHVRYLKPEPARASIRIAITRAQRPPGSKPTAAELVADCDFHGISTAGKKRTELEAELAKVKTVTFEGRKVVWDSTDQGFVAPTVCRFPENE